MSYIPHTVWVTAPPAYECQKRTPTWRKASPCTAARDAFIVSRRQAGEKFKDIAKQAGLSIGRCCQIYAKQVSAC